MDDKNKNEDPTIIPSCCIVNGNENNNEEQISSQGKANKSDKSKQNDDTSNRDNLQNSCCTPRSSCCDFTGNVNIEQLLLEDLYTDRIRKFFTPIGAQTFVTLVCLLIVFTSGLALGFSAILLPQLRKTEHSIRCDNVTAPWIASSATISMAPGSFIVGFVMEKYGRRSAHIIICIPIFLGWLVISSAQHLAQMLLGRAITGLCVGFIGPLTGVFIGECAAPKLRGFTLAGGALAIASGVFTVHLIGTFFYWRTAAIIFTAVPFLGLFCLRLIPESPIWLISKGRTDVGIKTFFWLRGRGESARREIKDILDAKIERDKRLELSRAQKIKSLKRREFIKPLLTMMFFHVTSQFSGVNVLIFYAIDIVEECVGTKINDYAVMMSIDSVRIIMGAVACVLCKNFRRRPLLFVSGSLSAISMLSLSLFIHANQGVSGSASWIPIICLIGFICSSSIALVPMPWMMCGEVFPTKLKSMGAALSTATAYIAFFLVVVSAPELTLYLGKVSMFFIYGLCTSFGTCVLFFILPETMGKSLQQIQNEYKEGRKPFKNNMKESN